MKILVLGGTTFFGKSIVNQLGAQGHAVSVFTRGNRRPSDIRPQSYLSGDRRNLDDLKRANAEAKWDVVVDNIGYNANDVSLALQAFPSIGRYVFVSSVAVYRYTKPRPWWPAPFQEDIVQWDWQPKQEDLNDVHWTYSRGKRDAERMLVQSAKIDWSVVRPPVVYGPWDPTERGFWYLARILEGGPILTTYEASTSFRLVYSDDTAQAIALAATHKKAVRRAYNVGQGEVITLRDFLMQSAAVLGKKIELVNLPKEAASGMVGEYANMVNIIPDLERVKSELGFQPTPWEKFCETTARWFAENYRDRLQPLLKTRAQEIELASRHRA